MRCEVLRRFRDKETRAIHVRGEIVEYRAARATELAEGGFVKKLATAKKRAAKAEE